MYDIDRKKDSGRILALQEELKERRKEIEMLKQSCRDKDDVLYSMQTSGNEGFEPVKDLMRDFNTQMDFLDKSKVKLKERESNLKAVMKLVDNISQEKFVSERDMAKKLQVQI